MIQKILEQLPGLYGPIAGKPLGIFYQDWAKEKYTATEYDLRSAHNHPEFLPPAQKRASGKRRSTLPVLKPLITWEDTLKAHCIVQNVQFQEFDGF